jgi:hypothetical protein
MVTISTRRARSAIEVREAGLGERAGELSHAVRAEVEEDHGVPVTDEAKRVAIGIGYDFRLHELVGFASRRTRRRRHGRGRATGSPWP